MDERASSGELSADYRVAELSTTRLRARLCLLLPREQKTTPNPSYSHVSVVIMTVSNLKNRAALLVVAAIAFFASSVAVASADVGWFTTPVPSCTPGVDCHFSAAKPPMTPEDYQVYSTIGLMPGGAYPADIFSNGAISTAELQSLGFEQMSPVGASVDEPQAWWVGPLDEQSNGGAWQALS
jgi:hypothetical protein